MKKYLLNSTEAQTLGIKGASYRTFDTKAPEVQQLINESLHILDRIYSAGTGMKGVSVHKESRAGKRS